MTPTQKIVILAILLILTVILIQYISPLAIVIIPLIIYINHELPNWYNTYKRRN